MLLTVKYDKVREELRVRLDELLELNFNQVEKFDVDKFTFDVSMLLYLS